MAESDGASPKSLAPRKWLAYAAVIAAGAFVALVANQLWSLQKTSHFALAIMAFVGLAVASLFLRRLPDFLFVVLLLSIPVTGIVKTFFLTSSGFSDRDTAILLASGVIGAGPLDVVLAALYGVWAIEIFAHQGSRLVPRLCWVDAFVALLMLAYFLSSLGAPHPRAAWFSILFHVRYLLVYFYVSRRLEWRHVPMLLAALCTIAILESCLAYFQYTTGKLLSLAWDRGSGADLSTQYVVPGIEQRNRATGTCYESHGFGLFAALLCQFTLIWMLNRSASKKLRILSGAAFGMIAIALVCSFSRSAWITAAIALGVTWLVFLLWGEKQMIVPSVFAFIVALFALPWVATILYERFSTAEGLVDARLKQYPIAWHIWKDHFLFGYGAGNYMWALDTYNEGDALDLPPHNVLLWIGAEMGLLGVVAYFGLAFGMIGRAIKYIRKYPHPVSQCALAVMGCIITALLDGLTDPLYREPVVYMMFWLTLGVGVALDRLYRTWDGPESQVPVQLAVG